MAQIKLRIEMNKGRSGAPMEKLGEIAKQMERFLRSLALDMKMDVKRGEWLALNFRNGSVSWDAAFQVDVPESKLRQFNQSVEFVTDYDPDAEGINGLVSDNTLLEYGRLGERIDPDEAIGLGIYSPERKRLKWRRVEYRKASRIRQAMEAPLNTYGSVQGVLHSLLKEAPQPLFNLREAATDRLVKCFYKSDMYPAIIDALRFRSAVVHVSGAMRLDRAARTVDEIKVERLDRVEELSDDEFTSLFGMSPTMTGSLSTKQFIDSVREDG